MNILHLKYAVEVAKTQSISKAAENLYMGQPNLSRAIKELEETLGITIFKRTSKGIITTPDGDELLRRARRIIAQVDEMDELYRSKRSHKRTYSVCAPGAGYITDAISELSKQFPQDEPYEISFKEANAEETIASVLRGDCGIGIVRYQTTFEKHFASLFKEKKLISETMAEFPCVLLIRADDPMTQKNSVSPDDLKDRVEIARGDIYVPFLSLIDVKNTELAAGVDKRVYVFDRASQLELTASVPRAFTWVPPMPRALFDRYGLAAPVITRNDKIYKDVIIRKKSYILTEFDNAFITELSKAKSRYFR